MSAAKRAAVERLEHENGYLAWQEDPEASGERLAGKRAGRGWGEERERMLREVVEGRRCSIDK